MSDDLLLFLGGMLMGESAERRKRADLEAKNQQIEAKNQQMQEENSQLEARIRELEAKVDMDAYDSYEDLYPLEPLPSCWYDDDD